LTRHQADPCREFPPRAKMAAIVNCGDERRCNHRPNAWQLGEPAASFARPAKSCELPIKLVEPEIEAAEFVKHVIEKHAGKIR
jgi:hypothetical protein